MPTAPLVVEALSPDDETMEKLPVYAARGNEAVVLVDPDEHRVTWLALADGEYGETDRSALLDDDAAGLTDRIDWPS